MLLNINCVFLLYVGIWKFYLRVPMVLPNHCWCCNPKNVTHLQVDCYFEFPVVLDCFDLFFSSETL